MSESPAFSSRYNESLRLFERAASVIPGGIYGHHSPVSVLPLASPYYAQSAYGGYYRDVDGNQYLDLMCGYGPIVLGHVTAEVEEAAEHQRRIGNCFNHPAPVMVELAEWLTTHIDGADWTVFGKNGSDMTSWALQVAREYTSRRKLLKVRGAYHGTHPWATPGHGGLIEEDKAHVHDFVWNDLESFEAQINAHGNDLAAVMITPYHHPVFDDQQWASEGFLKQVQRRCREIGALLILDDIRAGFRLNTAGSHVTVGIEPDLMCYCKAIANGYPVSACAGVAALKPAASRVFLTGSYWNGAVGMAAALATLRVLERENIPKRLARVGTVLQEGMRSLGKKHALPVRVSGPPALPYMRFENDPAFHRQQRFCALCMEGGIFLHPHHNWFLCAAHTEDDMRHALGIMDAAMGRMENE